MPPGRGAVKSAVSRFVAAKPAGSVESAALAVPAELAVSAELVASAAFIAAAVSAASANDSLVVFAGAE
jgi:hypothetical protein